MKKMENIFSIGERLREERERLGFNQTDFAALATATRQTQSNYEKGERSPDANYLLAIGAVGADVQYILTGRRTTHMDEPRAGYVVEPLKPDEAALLDNYRHSSPEARAALRATSDALAQQREVKPSKGKEKP